ncbi:hypothetical protein [Mycetocola reblochoni]|uniref:Secreted protein n=2 Tax=Mycetocola reblochoni TaxID=331618 RepID=A0A3L6ZNF6_9MICO|nr:hypothetical protein [Mycetocola reblochoni]RLP69185.1 hypothetical protein D9V30_07660 [Mycetocola reblochoni]SJN16415.1 putative secreted protein [Mycetocola reblochoni REB411]
MTSRTTRTLLASTALGALLLSGCSSAAQPDAASTDAAAEPGGRIALTYDGGIYVLDATSLEQLADLPLEGFNRLNPAGDGRHAMITTTEGFRALDTGSWTDDSGSAQSGEPAITDILFPAEAAGHVVRHGGRTVLFADGTGDITLFDSEALRDVDSADDVDATIVTSEHAHHGVAIELTNGTLLSTLGTSEERSGVRLLDSDHETELSRSEDCPSVHGEGTVKGEIAVFGCENGALVVEDGAFTKLDSPTDYGRIGNLYVSEESPIAFGDYNSDPDSEGYLLTELARIDTEAGTLERIELPEGVSYTWRGAARSADGDLLLLGSDGALHVVDEATGEVTASHELFGAWESPSEWQESHPGLTVLDGVAYATDTATNTVYAVDPSSGEVLATAELEGTPNELVGITG